MMAVLCQRPDRDLGMQMLGVTMRQEETDRRGGEVKKW